MLNKSGSIQRFNHIGLRLFLFSVGLSPHANERQGDKMTVLGIEKCLKLFRWFWREYCDVALQNLQFC